MPLLGIHPSRTKSTSERSKRTYVQKCSLPPGSEDERVEPS